MSVTLTTGQKIIRARLLLGAWATPPRDLSQTDLAVAVGLTQGAVGHWESDRREPDTASYKKLARILGVQLDWLMADRGPMYADGAERPNVQPPTPKPADAAETPVLDMTQAERHPARGTRPAKTKAGRPIRRDKRGG